MSNSRLSINAICLTWTSPAFEFSKRKFVQKYGKDIPVWALLASGSTGGVRKPSSLGIYDTTHVAFTDCVLVSMLSAGYVSPSCLSFGYVASPAPSADVVKSRIQLRATPPEGTPVQYIAREIRTVIAESGAYVLNTSGLLILSRKVDVDFSSRSGLFRGLTPTCKSNHTRRCATTYLRRLLSPHIVLRR